MAKECANQDGGGTLVTLEFMPWPVYRCSHLPVFSKARHFALAEAPRNGMASQLNVGQEVTGEQKGHGCPSGRNNRMKKLVAQGARR